MAFVRRSFKQYCIDAYILIGTQVGYYLRHAMNALYVGVPSKCVKICISPPCTHAPSSILHVIRPVRLDVGNFASITFALITTATEAACMQQQQLPQSGSNIHYIRCSGKQHTARQQTPLTPACHQFRIAIRPCPFIVTPGQPDSRFIPKQCSDERIQYCKPLTTLLIFITILASCKTSFTNKCVDRVL